jgi:hypothetical protein
MKFLKSSRRKNPRISFVLLDWSVRESFHLLHYLGLQNVSRDLFEVLVIEYYSRESEPVRRYEDQVDTWLLLQMPEECYYHKHLMYNAGILLGRGEIIVICDSDAMVREGFVAAVIDQFEKDPAIVLHLDQFRNVKREYHPFNFPTFEEVMGAGCMNNVQGKTKGILDAEDPLHTRNYGACMCARREDLVAIGGADEHIDYLGHICGPYEMTFRLFNLGRREIWHEDEFLYHTWHPGQAGVANYLGPHDGRHMSTLALEALTSGRILPFVENPLIRSHRSREAISDEAVMEGLVDETWIQEWRIDRVRQTIRERGFSGKPGYVKTYKGRRIDLGSDGFRCLPIIEAFNPLSNTQEGGSVSELESATLKEMESRIDRTIPLAMKTVHALGKVYLALWLAMQHVKKRVDAVLASPSSGSGEHMQKLTSRARYHQFLTRTGDLSRLFCDLTASLHLLRERGWLEGKNRMGILMTDSNWSKSCLGFLSRVGILPPVKTACIHDSRRFEEFWRELVEKRGDVLLILTRDLYAKHHALPFSREIRQKAVII